MTKVKRKDFDVFRSSKINLLLAHREAVLRREEHAEVQPDRDEYRTEDTAAQSCAGIPSACRNVARNQLDWLAAGYGLAFHCADKLKSIWSEFRPYLRVAAASLFFCAVLFPQTAPPVTILSAVHHDGQTFLTWKDAAEGPAGANYRYNLYRSATAITGSASLAGATLIQAGIFNNSGQLAGQFPFSQATRQDSSKLMAFPEQGSCGAAPNWTECGTPLNDFSGMAVYTAVDSGAAYYAVVTLDRTGVLACSPISPGKNATTSAVFETVAAIEPLKYYDSLDSVHRVQTASTFISGTPDLPMWLKLHASGSGSGSIAFGDRYTFWGTSLMGYQDGIQRAFSVYEDHGGSTFGQPALILSPSDTVWTFDGLGQQETYWFGYLAAPLGSSDETPRAQPSTEEGLTWLVNWAIERYGADPNRVYGWGQSMGAWGISTWALRHPEIFAAVFPEMPRWRQTVLPNLATKSAAPATSSILMPDQMTSYLDRMDMVDYIQSHCGQRLPFIGWGIGRQDGYATWQEQVDAVTALKVCRQGFAFNWNDGNHSAGASAASAIRLEYQTAYAKNVSYPAFTNSSLDADPGDGDPDVGDPSGCINCGFQWSGLSETANTWTVSVSNSNNIAAMTVDMTARNTQLFRPNPGRVVTWITSTGQSGSTLADAYGLVTAPDVVINSFAATTISFSAPTGGVSLSSRSLQFGNQLVGTPSVTRSVRLTNEQLNPLAISSISTGGDFRQTNNCASGLAPGKSCVVNVTFSPTVVGSRTATLAIAHNGINSPSSVALAGAGMLTVQISPASLLFPAQAVNQASSPQAITLTNNQAVPLSIGPLTTTGDFSRTSNCGVTLPAASTCTISVTFTPSATGTRTGTLSLVYGATAVPLSVALSGLGAVPVSLSVSSLSFNMQAVGSTSTAKNVTLTNNQTVPLTITSIADSGDFNQTSNCGVTLPAASTCTISVTLPVPLSVALSGSGILAASLSVPSLSFSKQVVGSASTAKIVTLTNNQTVPLTISSIAASGDFSQTSNCAATMPAASTCTISVTFTPSATGTRTGTLTLVHSAAPVPLSMALSGSGILPVSFSVASLSFSNEVVGSASTERTVTLTNNQAVPLTITSIAAAGDFSQTSNCAATIAAASACTISVTFTPSELGVRSGSVTVAHSAANSPSSLPLGGSGVAMVVISSSSLSFATQAVGTGSAARNLTLTNNQKVRLIIDSIVVSGDFVVANTCGGSLPAGGTCIISVAFAPTAAGTRSGTLTIDHNAMSGPQSVGLTGTGAIAVALTGQPWQVSRTSGAVEWSGD
ncbi:MAG: choice-of-anchor D domain-containing protein [Acidobacteria bacterium]|nr:choice-of-anchor D domain-containing protein [Acidobacteriota bacterium]